MKTRTLVLGATPNEERFAYLAAHKLVHHGYDIVNVGIREGELAGQPILQGTPPLSNIDTVTLYVGPQRQPPYYDWLLRLRPRRIIFNPGTENPELAQLAREAGIEPLAACTLVLLGTRQY